MPKNLSADQFFDPINNPRSKLYNDIINLKSAADKTLKAPVSGFVGDHSRIFILDLDKETNQWKRVPLSQKYSEDIFNGSKMVASRSDVIDELYELVDQGKLFFYDRGSNVPMQYKIKESENIPGRYNTILENVENDPRFETINAQRAVEASEEVANFQQYQENLRRESVVKDFRANKLLSEVEYARDRAHKAFSLTNPKPLTFLYNPDYTCKPIEYKGGSQFSSEEIETIVLAACDSLEAAAMQANQQDKDATAEEKMIRNTAAGIHQDVLLSGRQGSAETMMPVFEKGREIAGDLIHREMDGDQTQLKQVLMNSLRNHIRAGRDTSGLGTTQIRVYEEAAKIARLMDYHQLFDDYKEFSELKEEAQAMGFVAETCMAGAKAKQELMEAYQKGGFESEQQRLSIIRRIEASRYLTARETQSETARVNDPERQPLKEKLNELHTKNVNRQAREQQLLATGETDIDEADCISVEEYNKEQGRLLSKDIKEAKRRPVIQEVMDEIAMGNSMERRLREYSTVTDESLQLQQITDPYKMIEALQNLPDITREPPANALVADWKDKLAKRIDVKTAEDFWKDMLAAMGPNQFEPKLVEEDLRRLVIAQVDEDGDYSTKPLFEALGYKRKTDLNVNSMEDAEMMQKVRDQIQQGNVFFFKRGNGVPHRVSLGEDGAPELSEKMVEAKEPSLWAKIVHFLTGGRAYREEFERYNQEKYFRGADANVQGFIRNLQDTEKYEAAKEKEEIRKAKEVVERGASAFWDMEKVRGRAHKILSLDKPEAVSFEGKTPDYKGTAYAIPEGIKNKFTDAELDALCVAGISSRDAADAYMKSGKCKVAGTTVESTADALEGHIYHDILVWGRYDSEVFFPLVDAGRKIAAEALDAYAKGETDQMAKLLGDSIKATVLSGRYDKGVKSDASLGSDLALRMVGMLEKDPNLKAKCGIDEETLKGYKQELTGMRIIGQAYERAGAAYRKLAEIERGDYLLNPEDSQQIAADLLTYNYLNSLQTKGNDAASQRPDIQAQSLIFQMKQVPVNKETGERLNPLSEETMELTTKGQTRIYHLSDAEWKDQALTLKQHFTEPFKAVIQLGETTLDQIRTHVMSSTQFKTLSQINDGVEFAKAFNKMSESAEVDKLSNEVGGFRKQEHIKQDQEKLKQLQDLLKENTGLKKEVEAPVIENKPIVAGPMGKG